MARRNPNHVRPALVPASYQWLDSTMVVSSLVPAKKNPAVSAQEVVVVAGVGAVLALVGQKVTTPMVLGTGLYALGYFAKQQGWLEKYTK